MTMVLERDAKVTAQGQTTVPAPVRERLGIVPGDRITFAVDVLGTVTLRRSDEGDPAMDAFLEFIDRDIQQRPDQIQALTGTLEKHLRALTAKTKIDRGSDCISGDVGL